MRRKRPDSEDKLTKVLRVALDLAFKKKYDKAIEICDWLMEDRSTRIAGLRQRATVKGLMRDVSGAIEDYRAVMQEISDEPDDFYSLGKLLMESGSTAAAIASFTKVIEISDATGFFYYKDPAILWRAEAHLKTGFFDEALADASRLPAKYSAYLAGHGMRAKEAIMAEAAVAIGGEAKNESGALHERSAR